MPITFTEVAQEILNLVRVAEELKRENEVLKQALKAVREPDNKKE